MILKVKIKKYGKKDKYLSQQLTLCLRCPHPISGCLDSHPASNFPFQLSARMDPEKHQFK